MKQRTIDDYSRELRRILADRPDEGWVFGVCATIARRSGWELWVVRLIAALCLLSVTLITLLIYFILAMLFVETRPRAQQRMMRWARRADDLLDVLMRGLRNLATHRQPRTRSDDHHASGQGYQQPHNGA